MEHYKKSFGPSHNFNNMPKAVSIEHEQQALLSNNQQYSITNIYLNPYNHNK